MKIKEPKKMSKKIFAALLVAGCGASTANFTNTSFNPPGANPVTLNGAVQSGGTSTPTPLRNARVLLFEATGGSPNLLGAALTDEQGNFSLTSPKGTTGTVFYAAAEVRPGVRLVNVLGPDLPNSCTINELTSVVAAFTMNQFIQPDRIAGNPLGLKIASGMDDNLVSPVTGASGNVLLSPPNADQSNSLRSTRALSNMLVSAVRTGDTEQLFQLTTPPGGSAPTDTFQALVNIARNPANQVAALYSLSKGTEAYAPGLAKAPDAWTLTVKVNDTGDDTRLFAGPANTVFDKNGYAWITNNFVQGTPNGGTFDVVLKPNGQPADGSNGTPRSPLLGGGIKAGGYGLDIDPRGHIWLSNFTWGNVMPNPGSVTELDPIGHPLSPDDTGYPADTLYVQGIKINPTNNNVWLASYGNDKVVVLPGGNANNPKSFSLPALSEPFGVALASDGTAWVSCSGGFQSEGPPSVVHLRFDGTSITQVRPAINLPVGAALKAAVVDSQDNVWVASQGGNKVYSYNSNGDLLGTFSGVGGMNSPWGACIDGDDNVWLANFGPLTKNSFYSGCLTKLAGQNAARRPAGLAAGAPLTPPTGFTLHSAGAEVTLHNGQPLYSAGIGPAHSFEPLQRLTSVEIDQAGNVWATNNWKPDVDVDSAPNGNPGGDGIVIFLGIAKPPAPRP